MPKQMTSKEAMDFVYTTLGDNQYFEDDVEALVNAGLIEIVEPPTLLEAAEALLASFGEGVEVLTFLGALNLVRMDELREAIKRERNET